MKSTPIVPPFIPEKGPMRVLTVRIQDSQKKKLHRLWRNNDNFSSISQIVQYAIAEYLMRHSED